MANTPKELRQALGCGYELPVENARPWEPPVGKYGFRQLKGFRLPTICPGYSVNLPEVREASRAYAHWDRGQLRDFCGEQPSEGMMLAVEILDAEINAQQAWSMTPEENGGGRKS